MMRDNRLVDNTGWRVRVRAVPGSGGFVAPLRDRTRVLVRPVGPEDRPRIRQALARSSAQSRYQRFEQPLGELSDDELRYFTEIDQVQHVAWIGLDLADSAQTAVGVARLIRESSSATHGEWAVLVVDDYHGLGLGTILMATLYAQAQRVGLTTLRAYVLPDNAKGLSWLAYLGATLAEDGVPRILDLPVGGPFPRNGTAERFQQWVAGVNEALRRSQAGGSAGSERL